MKCVVKPTMRGACSMISATQTEIGRAQTPCLGHGLDQVLILADHRDEDVGQVRIGIGYFRAEQIVSEEPFTMRRMGGNVVAMR